MVAAYTFDFADREATLAVTSPASTQPIVTVSLALDAARDRSYTFITDAVGNVTSITEAVECLADVVLENRTITDIEVHQSCAKVTAGPDVTVDAGGSLTLRGARLGNNCRTWADGVLKRCRKRCQPAPPVPPGLPSFKGFF